MIDQIIQQSQIFQGVEEAYIKQLLHTQATQSFKKGDFIVHQNDSGDGMYFLLEGEVEILVPNKGDKNRTSENLIKTLKEGDFFGEICMFEKQKRTASARAKTDVKLLYLDANQFRKEINESRPNAVKICFNIALILVNHLHQTNKFLVDLHRQLSDPQKSTEISRFKKQLMNELLI